MIYFEKTAQRDMALDALAAFPDECCGFLFGLETDGGDREISRILVVNNAKEGDRRRRFEVSAKDYLRAERFAEAENLALLGVYHSHPLHPAVPSETDRVAAQPFFSYVILSVFDDEIRATTSWRLNDDHQFEPEIIEETQFV